MGFTESHYTQRKDTGIESVPHVRMWSGASACHNKDEMDFKNKQIKTKKKLILTEKYCANILQEKMNRK